MSKKRFTFWKIWRHPKIILLTDLCIGSRWSLYTNPLGLTQTCRNLKDQLILLTMAIRVMGFSNRGYKIRKIFTQESTYSKENYWISRLWLKGRCQRVPKFDFQSQFSMSKIIWIFLKFNNFLWLYWFLGKNLSNFVPPIWKLHNPYCHTYAHQKLMPQIFRPSCCHAEVFFSRLQNKGGQNLVGFGNFSTTCSFFCSVCSFYCTADARSDSEIFQNFLKNWFFLTYFVPIISKPIWLYLQ